MAGAGSAPGERAVMTKLPKPVFLDPPATMTDKNQRKAWSDRQKQSYRGYTTLVSQMARASELESPARRGHFLREFGQSDREVIENSEKIRMIFQAMLTRKPTEKEMTLARAEVAAHGDEAYPGIVWALLNTQQFIFVQ